MQQHVLIYMYHLNQQSENQGDITKTDEENNKNKYKK
jgi:hypothetical protein